MGEEKYISKVGEGDSRITCKSEDKRKRKQTEMEVSQKDNHVTFTERIGLEANSPQSFRVKCTCIYFPSSLSFSGFLHIFPTRSFQ